MRHYVGLIGLAVALVSVTAALADDEKIQISFAGDWTGAAQDGTEVTYSFSTDGTVIWKVKEKEFTRAFPEGLKARYQVRVGKPPWEIDIYEFADPRFKDVRFRGILEVIDGQSFKMEGRPSNLGERPKEFGAEAVVFRTAKK